MMVAALALVSCNKSEMDPLSGVFPDATIVEYTTLTSCEAVKDESDRRVFTLDLTDGTTPMHLTLIGNKYFLTANQYTEALDAVAKNGNFVLGKTSIGGKAVKQGYINVALLEEKETENGCENTYSINSVVFLEDGTPYKTSWTGKIAFEKDAVLEPQYYYTDTVAQDCTLEDGATLVEDVESHTLVLNDLSGTLAAQIKLVRAKGTGTNGLAGTYTVKEYAHEDFSAGNGFDLGVYFGMDPGAFIIGSYYVADGKAVIIEPGATITVTEMGAGGFYSIDGDGFSFLCAPEGYVPGGVTIYDMTDTVAQDCTLEDGSTLVETVESHTLVLKDGDQFAAQIKLVRNVGTTDLAGEYTVKEYAHEDFSAGNGFDLGVYYGMDPGAFVIGSYYIGEEGAVVIIEPGEKITVTNNGNGLYTFTGSTDWEFKGQLSGGEPGPGPEPQDNWDYTPGAAYKASNNLWKPVDDANAAKFFSYLNPGWGTPINDNIEAAEFPFLTKKESTYKLQFENYTDGRWQNQFYIFPGSAANFVALDPAKTYDLSFTVCSTETFNAFVKFSKYVDAGPKHEGEMIWEPDHVGDPDPSNIKFVAGEPVVLEKKGLTGVEASNIIFIFDFGTNPAGAVIYIKDITLVEVGGEQPPVEAVELSEFLSLTDYGVYGMKMIGLELGTPGFSYQPADWVTTWSPSYPVDGQFIKLELYSEDGKVAPGTYVPSAANGAVNAGEFNLGADNGWGGFNGTSWFTVANGAASGVAVTDGTVTVSQEGDVYTIEIATSAVNAKYVGKLSNETGAVSVGGITIDGNFDDWADIPGATPADAFNAFKVWNDADNFYFYVETDPGSRLWSGGAYLYLYFNYKNDLTQGAYGGKTGMGDNKYDAYIYMYLFGGSADAPEIVDNPNNGTAEGMTMDNIVIAGNHPATSSDIVKMEIVIPRANFTDQVNAGDVIEIDSYRSKDGGIIYFPGYVVK